MATGLPPFRGDTTGMIFDSVLNQAPVPSVRLNTQISPKLDEVINKALEKDRAVRYQHASDIAADLRRFKRDMAPKAASSSRWSRVQIIVGALVLSVAAVVLALVAKQHFVRPAERI